MTEEELLGEVRSVFEEAMGNDTNFPFQFLQVAGGGSKSLTIPVLSASYTWTAREVAKMAGQGCLYIQAQAALKEYNCDSEADIDLTQDQVSTHVHTMYYAFMHGCSKICSIISNYLLTILQAVFCIYVYIVMT